MKYEESDVFRLSRHVNLRPIDGGLVAESLLSGQTLELSNPSTRKLLLSFVSPVRLGDLLAAVPAAQRGTLEGFVELCMQNRLLTRVLPDGAAEEDTDSLRHWEHHDLFFHVRSRRGRNRAPFGATYHLRDELSPVPALKTEPEVPVISLARADFDHLREHDAPLTRVLEQRRSGWSVAPLDLETLGVFLDRTLRVVEVKEAGGEQLLQKLYPSGGSLHSLEVYVTPANCPGLERGIYHYRPMEHGLAPVCEFDEEVEELLRGAQRETGTLADYPPVLLTFTARFRRVMQKYQSLAYRLIMAEVGVLYQTMYLVATAMGLSPRAVGAGDSDRFARLIGADYYDETSVGEFLLGGPEDAQEPAR